MKTTLKGRSLLTLENWSPEELTQVLDRAAKLKADLKKGRVFKNFRGKSLAILFEKTSTRTRCAFETAFSEEGGHPVFLGKNDIQLGKKETIEDTARVLGRMFDAIAYRGFAQKTVELLAEYSGKPVYNALTDTDHPTQILADLLTLREHFGYLKGLKVVYLGDGRNNVAISLLMGCAKLGVHCTIAAPKVLFPDLKYRDMAQTLGNLSGSRIQVTEDREEALRDADALYTDVWVSMGEEHMMEERVALLQDYQVNRELMASTGKPGTRFLHCLPAVRGQEVTSEVLESPASLVWDQAENRKHTIRALMLETLLG